MKRFLVGIQLENDTVFESEIEEKSEKEALDYLKNSISWFAEELK